jgi:hypothetical protein
MEYVHKPTTEGIAAPQKPDQALVYLTYNLKYSMDLFYIILKSSIGFVQWNTVQQIHEPG